MLLFQRQEVSMLSRVPQLPVHRWDHLLICPSLWWHFFQLLLTFLVCRVQCRAILPETHFYHCSHDWSCDRTSVESSSSTSDWKLSAEDWVSGQEPMLSSQSLEEWCSCGGVFWAWKNDWKVQHQKNVWNVRVTFNSSPPIDNHWHHFSIIQSLLLEDKVVIYIKN